MSVCIDRSAISDQLCNIPCRAHLTDAVLFSFVDDHPRVQRQSLHERLTADHGSDIPVATRILGETVVVAESSIITSRSASHLLRKLAQLAVLQEQAREVASVATTRGGGST